MSLKFILINYLIIVNTLGFFINIADKQAAIHKRRRVPEAALWTMGLIGGAAGSYIAMKLFRHKTRHKSFMLGMPLLIVLDIIFIIIIYKLFL